MQVVHAGPHALLPLDEIGQLDPLLVGDQPQHPHHALDDRRDRDALRRLDDAAVEPREPQQIFRDARQAVGLLHDVADELAHRGGVDVLGLQNRVGEQADTGQRRFQLVARVGDKAAARLLRRLQAVGEAVELLGDLADLVATADLGVVAVRALAHAADGLEQHAEAAREHPREQQAQQHDKARDCRRDAQQILLQRQQQRRLLHVVLIGIDRADGLAAVDDRRGRAAAERAVGKVGIEGIVAPQRLHDLGVKPVAAHRAVRLAGVVEDAPRGVRDENAGNAGILHQRHRGGDVLLAQLLQAAQRRHHHAHAALQRRLLGAHDQIFRHDQRVGVHENEHCRNDQNITQAEFDL